jgi:putative sigma-54 modulation protein
MQLVIKSKNMEVADQAEEYIRRKMAKLERHLPSMDEVTVELTEEMTKAVENRYVVQVTISSNGTLLRAEERAANVNAAVDTVVDVLKRQIERYKGKLNRKHRKGATPRKDMPMGQEGIAPRITRVKRFPVRSMLPEEAADQMELLGHNFFLFFNDSNEQLNVLYRRNDGTYGVIEPEL